LAYHFPNHPLFSDDSLVWLHFLAEVFKALDSQTGSWNEIHCGIADFALPRLSTGDGFTAVPLLLDFASLRIQQLKAIVTLSLRRTFLNCHTSPILFPMLLIRFGGTVHPRFDRSV
jgi:hypothetical protein